MEIFMLKNIFGVTLAAALAVGVVYANQTASNTLVVPVNKAPANNGKQMYASFCAPCHGLDGRGQGPMAAALKQQPTNLALLSKNNGGKFPDIHIVSVLQFGAANPSHGTAQMPVWGPVFSKLDESNPSQSDELRSLRINNLSEYLRTLQEK
jgi:mono/diheme cytochrome c family protein